MLSLDRLRDDREARKHDAGPMTHADSAWQKLMREQGREGGGPLTEAPMTLGDLSDATSNRPKLNATESGEPEPVRSLDELLDAAAKRERVAQQEPWPGAAETDR